MESPIGDLTLAVKEGALCGLRFNDGWSQLETRLRKRFAPLELRRTSDPAGIVSRLRKYFAGDLAALADIVVDTGGTDFQQQVWHVLQTLKPGETASYRDVAQAIGKPAAVRAVGAANGTNPVGIVIPCHRVIAADGTLCGYGGGLERKRWLLQHEGAGRGTTAFLEGMQAG
jgi:methylated-DNA-[protein]-cysteine S-methyltransferase